MRRLWPDLDCNIGGAISSRHGQIALHDAAPLRRLPFQCLRDVALNDPEAEALVTWRWHGLKPDLASKPVPSGEQDKQPDRQPPQGPVARGRGSDRKSTRRTSSQ